MQIILPHRLSVGLLQADRDYSGGRSLHPARKERLPDGQEELKTKNKSTKSAGYGFA